MTKFGAKYYGSPAPTWVKLISYAVISIAAYLFTNIDASPIESETLKTWLKWLAPVALPGIALLKDFFGTPTLNEEAQDK